MGYVIMKKAYILIGTALAALLVLVSCSESGENEIDASSSLSASTSSYSEEYSLSIQEKLYPYMDEFEIAGMGIDGENRLCIDMLDTSEEMLAKVEAVIGEEAMDACIFTEVSDYPHTD